MPDARAPFSGDSRAYDGFILQAVGPSGKRRWYVRRGVGYASHSTTLLDSLREVCDLLDALPDEWKVETISSPGTIYRDLQGTRAGRTARKVDRVASTENVIESMATPERFMLGHIGRLDLLTS